MTCRQMGGSCDTVITGATAEEMINNGAKHVAEAAGTGDAEHQKILEMMNDMMTKPEESAKWNQEFAEKFDALPTNP